MPYEENLEDGGSIMKKMKFMTSKGGALQEVDSTMISTKEQIIVVGNMSLGKRELRYIPFIGISISSLVERER